MRGRLKALCALVPELSADGDSARLSFPHKQLQDYSWLQCRPAEGVAHGLSSQESFKDDSGCAIVVIVGDLHLMKRLLLPGPLHIAATLLEFLQRLVTVKPCKAFCKH